MSYKDKQGQAQLCIVDLAHPSVHVDLSHWQAVGMQGTQTAQVHFDNTPVIPIGLPNCYLGVRVLAWCCWCCGLLVWCRGTLG